MRDIEIEGFSTLIYKPLLQWICWIRYFILQLKKENLLKTAEELSEYPAHPQFGLECWLHVGFVIITFSAYFHEYSRPWYVDFSSSHNLKCQYI